MRPAASSRGQGLLAAIGAKLVGPHGGLQVGKCHTFGAPNSNSVLLSILLLVAIGRKLIGPHGDLQVGMWAVHDKKAPWKDPYVAYMTKLSLEVYKKQSLIIY